MDPSLQLTDHKPQQLFAFHLSDHQNRQIEFTDARQFGHDPVCAGKVPAHKDLEKDLDII